MIDTVDGGASDSARSAVRAARTSANGPPVVWIRFDDASLEQLAPPDRRNVVPRDAIARLLDRIRTDRRARPTLVFLDVAIGERVAAELPMLSAALARWRGDRSQPPMAVFAGRGCAVPPGDADRFEGAATPAYFNPLYAGQVSTVRDAASAATNLIWACPTFAGLQQAEFSCVTTLSNSGLVDSFALPSPAWFADSVARAGRAAGPGLVARLADATRRCRGGAAASGDSRPFLSAVDLAYRSDDGRTSLSNLLPSGRPQLSIIPAADLLRNNADLGALAGAIVVIGGGSSWSPDMIGTEEEGNVPGSVLVGFALRQALVFSLDAPPGRLLPVLIFIVVLVLMRVLTLVWPWLRRDSMAHWPRTAWFWFLVYQEQVLVVLLVVILLALPALILPNVGSALVAAIIAAELMLVADNLRKDWTDEKTTA